MRNLVVAVALSLATITMAPAYAQDRATEIDHLFKSGRHIKVAGQVLVGLGCVDAILSTVIGAVAVAAPPDSLGDVTPGSIRGSDVPTLEGASVGFAVASAVLIAVGIPLMAEGDARLEQAHRLD